MGSCFWTDFVGCGEDCATNSPLLNALAWYVCGAFYCGTVGHAAPPASLGLNVVDSYDDYSEVGVTALNGAVVTPTVPAQATIPVRAAFRSDYDSGAGGKLAVNVGFSSSLADPTQLAFEVDYLDASGNAIVSANASTTITGTSGALVLDTLNVATTNWSAVVSARVTILSNTSNPLPAGQTASLSGVTLSAGWDAEC